MPLFILRFYLFQKKLNCECVIYTMSRVNNINHQANDSQTYYPCQQPSKKMKNKSQSSQEDPILLRNIPRDPQCTFIMLSKSKKQASDLSTTVNSISDQLRPYKKRAYKIGGGVRSAHFCHMLKKVQWGNELKVCLRLLNIFSSNSSSFCQNLKSKKSALWKKKIYISLTQRKLIRKIFKCLRAKAKKIDQEDQDNMQTLRYQSNQEIQRPQSITEIIKLGVNCLREGGFKTFIEQGKNIFSDCIDLCLNNWEIYSYQLQEPLMRFTRILEIKIKESSLKESFSNRLFYQKFEPMVQKLLNFFSADSFQVLLKTKGLNQNVGLAEMKKILEVCDEPQHENSVLVSLQSSKIQINRKKGQRPQLNNSSFNSTQASLNLSQAASTIYSDYLATIDQQRVMETRCLGCSTFFLQNFNILDSTINRVLLEMFPSVWSMKEYENQIKNTICYLMNSKGGVILFDCLASSGVVLANGTKLTEKDKQLFEQRLYSYLEVFEPSEEVKRSVTVTYVPVVYSSEDEQDLAKKGRSFYLGEENFIKPGQSFVSREFIPGHFVMRVRVCPKSNTSVCFWRQSNNFDLEEKYNDYVCTINRDGGKTTIKLSDIGKEIKKRMKEQYLPENLTSKQLRLLSHRANYFDHECMPPQAGLIITQKPSICKQMKNSLDQTFEYACMLIAKKNYHNEIVKSFRQEGISCRIDTPFQNCNFNTARNCAILYHNKKFETMLQKIKGNFKFMFGGKPLLLISITTYLKLESRNEYSKFSDNQIKNLRMNFKTKFPNEQLQLFKFYTKNKRFEYYLKSGSIESTLFLYYYLNDWHEKVTFKNPLHLDRMGFEQKRQAFQEIYAESQKNQQKKPIFEEVSTFHSINQTFIAQKGQII